MGFLAIEVPGVFQSQYSEMMKLPHMPTINFGVALSVVVMVMPIVFLQHDSPSPMMELLILPAHSTFSTLLVFFSVLLLAL